MQKIFSFIIITSLSFCFASDEQEVIQVAALTTPTSSAPVLNDEEPDTLSISFTKPQEWILNLSHSIEIVPDCKGDGIVFKLLELPRVISRSPYTIEFVVDDLPEDFDPEGRNCIKQTHNIVHADINTSVAGINLRSPWIVNALGSAKKSAKAPSVAKPLDIYGTHAMNWIPPHFVSENGNIQPATTNCIANEIETRDFSEYPNECLSSVKVISKGPYQAKIQVYDNSGNFVHRSVQKFGTCGELKNKARDTEHGHVSWLVWNMEDSNKNPVGNGVYIWRVQFLSESSAPISYVYKQGIARTEVDDVRCDIAAR